MAGAASQAGDADSSRAPGLTSGLQGSVNVHRGALLLVPQWQCISSFVFYIKVSNIATSFVVKRCKYKYWIAFCRCSRAIWIASERKANFHAPLTRCIWFAFLSDAIHMAREHRQNAIQCLNKEYVYSARHTFYLRIQAVHNNFLKDPRMSGLMKQDCRGQWCILLKPRSHALIYSHYANFAYMQYLQPGVV